MTQQVVFDTLGDVMSQLRRLPDVLAVITARRDGVVLASNVSRNSDTRKVASMGASIVGTSEMAVGELHQGGFRVVMVESDEGIVVGVGAGEEAILIALIKGYSNIGLTLLNMKESAKKIQESLDSPEGGEALEALARGL